MKTLLLYLMFVIKLSTCTDPAIEEEELAAHFFMAHVNNVNSVRQHKNVIATWNYDVNVTEENLKQKLAVSEQIAKEEKEEWKQLAKYNWHTYKTVSLKRQFKQYSKLGFAVLHEDKHKKFLKILSDMRQIYTTAKICSFENNEECQLNLEPELTNIFLNSSNPEELKHVWVEWRKAIGPKVRRLFKEYVEYMNEVAKLNKFNNVMDYILDSYETKDFVDQIQNLWEQIKPLYVQIHAYVRYKLREKHGDIISEKGPIPAHLLGNMWAQNWRAIAKFTLPYPNKNGVDIAKEMVKQNYTPEKMFKIADEFFVSLNLTEMPSTFWEKSIFEKPTDGREMLCHAAAYDFSDGKDFRIRQCTRITFESFRTIHHEMGHVQYFLQYKHLPYTFRTGANNGFHEAVGDVIALSVSTTKHLRKLGLLNETVDDPKVILNNLYMIGLNKIVFLPFAYLLDQWRWSVLTGNTTNEDYNCKWWELRHEYQGIEPPVDRTEADFDPASKFHVIAGISYIRYFVSFVIQFQFHRALCQKAGEYVPNNPNKPLHECDIYQSTAAGNALGKMLQMGASRPWPDAMEVLTGQRHMDASGLLEYFEPLRKWLEAENTRNKVHIGWEAPQKVCTKETTEKVE